MGQDMSREEEEQFYYRHKIEVHLSLIAVNTIDSSLTRFALQDTSLPFSILKAGDGVIDTAKELYRKLTGSDSDWFVLKQVGVIDNPVVKSDIVVILYSIVIPEQVPLVNDKFRWVKYEELCKYPTLLGLTSLACSYHRIN